jgi:hypothetical protein
VAKPRVTVTCPCGERLLVPYGEQQTCQCGRAWDTAQIRAADYEAVRAVARRYRRNELTFVLLAVSCALVLILVGRGAPLILLVPTFLVAWFKYFRPWWRQRTQQRLRQLPTWTLVPRPGTGPSDQQGAAAS